MTTHHRHEAGAPDGRGGQFRAVRKPAADPRVTLEPHDDFDGGGEAPDVDSATVQELRDQLAPHQPVMIRRAASINAFYHRGLADVAAHDPDPLVRANAMYAPDLPAEERNRLASDPAVRRLMAVITR